MSRDGSEPKAERKKPRLVQTKLTSAFGNIKVSGKTEKVQDGHVSVYDAETKDRKINLYTSRRASFKGPPPPLPTSKRSLLLAAVAEETVEVLPTLLKLTSDAPAAGELLKPDTFVPALASTCPNLNKTAIRVVNMDSLDAAFDLGPLTVSTFVRSASPPVLVLNMANAKYGGGGWLKGAIAQEEALCYRSSLSFTLKHRFYPMSDRSAIYSPTVVVIRESLSKGHSMLDLSKPEELPVVSVVSMAALRDPAVQRRLGDGEEIYSSSNDRELMRSKIRMILRVAAAKGHRKLVLGALGCGAFGNPKTEVLKLWKEVSAEPEFNGGWWEDVVFAVMDNGAGNDSNSNYGVFWRGLNGLEV
ncbi:MAG: hypothetical protein LQ352_003396 [Teloschistes flavicans]|nr:MAG: hypothetical protein LQ352_003396 [Teloschistes flavicans]